MRLGFAVVRGSSMEPTLYDGDRLLMLHGSSPRSGRLAVVRLPGGVVAVKRAVRREADGWWVERDNPRAGVDSWAVGAVSDEDVLGRVLLRLPRRPRRVRGPGGVP
ncbi:MAG TPA: S24/S26 family peptidase [Marmoricola sp.]|nr:S24/S26 family peptidase [Marmoricola sp.]